MSRMSSCSVMGLKIRLHPYLPWSVFAGVNKQAYSWFGETNAAAPILPVSIPEHSFCSGVEPVCVQSERMESCVVRRRVVASRTWPGNINKLGEGEMEPMSLAQSFGASAHPDARLPLCQAPFLLPIHRHEN